MSPERWERVKDVFVAALEREEPERSRFLAQACQNDVELRREIDSLLSGHNKADDFLPPDNEDTTPISTATDGPPLTFSPGELIGGRFQVLRFVGQGGMGEVYQAIDLELSVR